jgi:hypothetical protein
MANLKLILLGLLFGLFGTAVVQADNSGRIYGKIHTVDGDTFEGMIRWDKNEGSWVDILDGTRDRDDREDADRSRSSHSTRRTYGKSRSSVKIFGITIDDESNNIYLSGSSAESGIRFGHLKSMEMIGDDRALLTLKNGKEVEFYNGSTDIGTSVREIVIEDINEGEIEFAWDDIELIEFSDANFPKPSVFGDRLYGTVSTRRGETYSGFICWDVDELFSDDVLDGDDQRRTRKIQFGKVAQVSRYSSSGAELVMKTGDTTVLRGTNDVDSDNRGIIVCDPAFGQVRINWDDFEKLDLTTAPRTVKYADFDGGRRLHGTVYTETGEEYTGDICWDDDEEYTWELLNGNSRDLEFKIEFGLVKQVEKNSGRSSEVTLLDGRVLRLRDSNDVDADNKGIIITPSKGDEIIVDWEDFARVVFDNK